MPRAVSRALAGMALLVTVLATAAVPAADAAGVLRARASLSSAGDGLRLGVLLSSTRKFTAGTRPRAVSVTGGGRLYPLVAERTGKRSMRWRSAVKRGVAAERLARLAGRRVVVRVRTRGRLRKLGIRLRRAAARQIIEGPGSSGGQGPSPGPTAPPPVVKPPDLFVATTGSDGGRCISAAPCRTFGRAFEVAQPGDLVQIAAGDYPPQVVAGAKPSPERITLRAAPGATVRVGMGADNCTSLRVNASHVEFGDMTTEEACADAPLRANVEQSHVIFRDITARGGLQVNSATDVSFVGGDYGPQSGYQNWNNAIRSVGTLPANILIDGARIHDVACSGSDPGCHIECLIVGGVNGLTVRNSAFYHCAIMDIFFETFNGPISNVLIENNFMADATEPTGGDGTGRPSIMFKGNSTITNSLIRFNSLYGPLAYESGGDPVNARAVGNVGVTNGFPCHPAVGYAYNVWSSGKCGDTDAVGGSSQWVNPASDSTLDYHLKLGAGAIDFVPDLSGDYELGFDIDGQGRPMGAGRDAGADERG